MLNDVLRCKNCKNPLGYKNSLGDEPVLMLETNYHLIDGICRYVQNRRVDQNRAERKAAGKTSGTQPKKRSTTRDQHTEIIKKGDLPARVICYGCGVQNILDV